MIGGILALVYAGVIFAWVGVILFRGSGRGLMGWFLRRQGYRVLGK